MLDTFEGREAGTTSPQRSQTRNEANVVARVLLLPPPCCSSEAVSNSVESKDGVESTLVALYA